MPWPWPGPARCPRMPVTHGAPPSSLPGDGEEAGGRWRERVSTPRPAASRSHRRRGPATRAGRGHSFPGPPTALLPRALPPASQPLAPASSASTARPRVPGHSGRGVLSGMAGLSPRGRVFTSLTPLIPLCPPPPASLPVLGTGQVGAGRAFVGWGGVSWEARSQTEWLPAHVTTSGDVCAWRRRVSFP